jgi:hypothetical protein
MVSRRALRAIISAMAGLVFTGAAGLVPAGPAGALPTPRELLVYYGWPSHINGATGPSAAAAEFGRYDYVVLGAGAEDPGYPDHANTAAMLADPAVQGTFVFGYVNLGVTNGSLSLDEVRARISGWQAIGADAVLLDAFGYDFGVTRERQNAAVEYAHSLGMPVLANAWFPADVFGSAADPGHNPQGLPGLLGAGDYYLSESYRILDGQYAPEGPWRAKAAELAAYQARLGFSILSVTTNTPADLYSEELFFAAWNAAAADGHLAIGWGEYLFSADDNLAPYRARPAAAEPPPAPADPPADPGEGGADDDPGGGGNPGDLPGEQIPAPSAYCSGVQATVVGTAGDDTLAGTPGRDVIAGLGGNDVIDGLGGDDLICGGAGDDTIRGGDGADRLVGGLGSDRLFGDAGDDLLRGNAGDDRAAGGEGEDRLFGGAGADDLRGNEGDDSIVGQRGDDLLRGDEGFDRARGGPHVDACDAERARMCEA